MILVTGGTGFIGSHLVERLAGQGCTLRCLVRRTGVAARVEQVKGDLESGDGLDLALRGVDTVIHLAGVTKARAASDYDRGNIEATANLVTRAGAVRRFVHVSSLAAAGPSPAGGALTEDDPPQPVSRYGRSKLAGERLVREKLGERAVVVRPPVVYGPGDRDVFQMIRSVAGGWMLEIGRAPRQFSLIYVKDLVDGIIAAADRGDAGGQLFYVAHPVAVSWAEFGETAARLMGVKLRRLAIPEKVAYGIGWCAEQWSRINGKPGILSRDKVREACCTGWVCDSGRAASELDFLAPTGLEDGLRQTIAWYKEAGWLKL